ncbi:TPA: NAD-dependent epimerase/dehydratase family protein [Candidatus Micrarchaeota archaeon]|nr:NAD-dependent epimerase/dehydratase family protein [Candidatus Micrarchaeota archaeon]
MISGKRILVTGGAGFIGSNLVAALSPANTVFVVDDLSEGFRDNIRSIPVAFFQKDVRDAEFMRKLMSKHKFHAIFHLAASFANQKSVENPVLDLDVNGMGTLKLLELSKEFGVETFLYASSSCIYGSTNEPIQEDMKPMPETPYAISKLLGEEYVKFYADFHKMNAKSVRFFNVYGPNEYPGPYRNVIPKFFALAKQKNPLTITGTGEETRDFTFVADAVEGTILVSEKGKPGEAYNIGSGLETKIIDLAKSVNEMAGNHNNIQFTPRRDWDHISRRLADNRKASELGWTAKTPLKEGLRKTFEWLESVKAGEQK